MPEPTPKERPKTGRKKVAPDARKIVTAITLDPDVIEWLKEWAARRERSFSWAMNHIVKERRNRELAEKHLGQKVVRR